MSRRFAEHGLTLRVPNLNVPSFEKITLTAQIARVAEEITALPEGDVCLVGSSMGAAVALHTANSTEVGKRVSKIMLLAPAFDFVDNRRQQFGEIGLETWRTNGTYPFMHYAYGEEKQVHYGLIEDILKYDTNAVRLNIPILIIHGLRDTVVSHTQSERYAAQHPNVTLRLVDAEHQLSDQLDFIWAEAQAFFGL
ncbi:MAG: hypothetical protein OHK0023_16810 [Anaerolineae bacterium]